MEKEIILVVDDAPDTLELIRRNLEFGGYRVITAGSADEAVVILDENHIDLVITDYKMPRTSGLDLIRWIHESKEDLVVMMITGYASIEGAVSAVKAGAEEYLAKPFTDSELLAAVERVLSKLRLRRKISEDEHGRKASFSGIIGKSEPMLRVYSMIGKAAKTSAGVLITGESGTGKELVARAIHYTSPRSANPFVPVNCAAIPSELMESELFGHEKGAFTGAHQSRPGFFESAGNGTIFLDEISELSLSLQAKLLRVIQEKEVYPVGARRPLPVQSRLVAASNKNLHNLVAKGIFREDLYYRLNVLNIELPSLKDRGDDLLLLIQHFARRFALELGSSYPRFSDSALEVMREYSWPGNVRELENLVQRLIIMSGDEEIDIRDLPAYMRSFDLRRSTGINRTLAEVEAMHIRNVLDMVRGNKTQAAKILNIDRKTLRVKLTTYGLE